MVSTIPDTAKHTNTVHEMTETTAAGKSFILAHFSDPHLARVDHVNTSDLLSKRLFGYLRYKLKRGAEHSDELLTILSKDLQRTKPDHIAITGDLTQLSLAIEFEAARKWLQSLGSASSVTAIPGNHDTYVKMGWDKTFVHWIDYMAGDSQKQPAELITSLDGLFPTLRIRGRIALIGINTAFPSGLHLATGKIGDDQLTKLEHVLKHLSDQHLFRIILIHHPPVQGVVSTRKSLTDAAPLRAILERYKVELLLFGHSHETVHANLRTQSGIIPAIGAPSVSSRSPKEKRRSRYYLYKITSIPDGWKVQMNERFFSLAQYRFIDGRQEDFSFPSRVI